MSADGGIFDGLLGYERVMLLCGVVLFVFALVLIAILVAQRRKFLPVIALLVVAIVLIGFPGIQTVKFSKDMVELERIRQQSVASTDAAERQHAAQVLGSIEQRSAGNARLQAKVADGYLAIGEVDKGYALAKSVLATDPSPAVRQTLVPVLTAKLEQSTPARPDAAALGAQQKSEIAAVASHLQSQTAATALPAESHIALARARLALDQPRRAAANVEAAKKIDPAVKVDPALREALRRRVHVTEPGH